MGQGVGQNLMRDQAAPPLYLALWAPFYGPALPTKGVTRH